MPDAENFFWNLREPPAAVHQLLLAAGQAGCDFGSMSRCSTSPFLPPGGAGGEFAAIGHLDRDGVVIRMQYQAFIGQYPAAQAAVKDAAVQFGWICAGSIQDRPRAAPALEAWAPICCDLAIRPGGAEQGC